MKLKIINNIKAYWNPFCQECGKVDIKRVSYHELSKLILCDKHKMQFKRRGYFQEQTRHSPNTIIIDGDITRIGLNNFNGDIIDWCIIDTEDIRLIEQYKWFKRVDGRVVSNVTLDENSKVTHIRIHNVVMKFDDFSEGLFEVDHIDNNTLNNTKGNLRIVSKSKNGMNRGLQSNNNTGVCGVVSRDHNNTSPWIPQIKIDGKMIRLGSENSFDKAVIKRIKSESELFKTNSNNYNFETNTLQLSYISHDDQLPTFIEVNLQGEIITFTKSPKELK